MLGGWSWGCGISLVRWILVFRVFFELGLSREFSFFLGGIFVSRVSFFFIMFVV